MDIGSLKTHLQPGLTEPLEDLWARFCTQPRPQSAENFLVWLFEKQLIGFDQLEDWLTHAPIETGAMPRAEAGLRAPELLRTLGQGAMGVVHLAQDGALLRKVAYKQLLGEASEPVLRRFLNEVRITAQLQHPAIVPVYQLTLAPGEGALPHLAYSMKLVKGDTLKEKLQAVRQQLKGEQRPASAQPLTLPGLLAIFLQVCDAMAYAHTRQVIHRDLKPANLMIGPYGDVYVMDWGIARRFQDADAESELLSLGPLARNETAEKDTEMTQIDQTQAGQILGTPRYMSPQQAAGKNAELDGRSDQFALGLILYEMLALRPAFQASNQIALLKQVLKAEIPAFEPYHSHWPIPPELRAIVLRATRRQPADRYTSVADMSRDIRRYLRGEPVSVYAEPALQRSLRLLRRHGRTTLLVTLAIVLGCLLVMLGSLLWQLQTAAANQRREAALSHFLSAAANRAQAIDQNLLQYQGRLEHLAAQTRQMLLQGRSQAGQFYFAADFAQSPPPNYQNAPAYHRRISLAVPGVRLAPGLTAQSAGPQLHKLTPLQPAFRQLFFALAGSQDSAATFEKTVRQQGLPLVWSSIALASGIELSYPAAASEAGADPRQRAGYLLARNHRQTFWGEPYRDPSGQGLLLPALAPLRDDSQQWLGVASFDLNLQRLSQSLLRLPDLPRVTRVELLNPAGQLLLRLANQPEGRADALQSFSPPQAYARADLPARLKSQPNGVMALPEGGQLAWFRLSSLGWYYVVTAAKGF